MVGRILLTVAIGCAAARCEAASGFFNMPTSLPQCVGCGWGPGYHAPMVLKPYYRAWNASQGIERAGPRDYPPIYNNHVLYESFQPGTSTLAAFPHAPGPPVQQHRPHYAPSPAVDFAPPALTAPAHLGAPRHLRPKHWTIPAEPSSPSDTPDLIPLPRRGEL